MTSIKHGFCTPLSAIHTQNSSGIGEIYDLIPLIDWMHSLGYSVLQLLPINDSGLDISPYNALSSLAINPVYLSLNQLPYLEKYPHLIKAIDQLKNLNGAQFVDYKQVRVHKEAFLAAYLEQVEHLILQDPDYQKYLQKNPWVTTYAKFITLDKANGYKHWQEWTQVEVDPFYMERQKIIQFLLYKQLKEIKNYATSKNVQLMGDIPILVSSQSADVWKHQHLFDLNNSVGVPPDMFTDEGQSWGFPVFKWKDHEDECFELWKQRLQYAENFYHAYRLDHVVGFFRLFVIPKDKKAKEGAYDPPIVADAIALGRKILTRLQSFTTMIPVGEDLGVVLPEFKQVMQELGIIGIKVVRWERFWDHGGGFIPLNQYNPLNLTCVSTHDTETLETWWNEKPDESKHYAAMRGIPYRPMDFDVRYALLKDSHQTSTIYHINLLNEYLALYPELIHENHYDERINTPGTISDANWRYRLRQNLETITSHPKLGPTLASLIT